MAFLTANHTAPRATFFQRLDAAFERLVAFGEKNPKFTAAKEQIARFEALSDAELAAKGLTRDMIAYYVFRNFNAI